MAADFLASVLDIGAYDVIYNTNEDLEESLREINATANDLEAFKSFLDERAKVRSLGYNEKDLLDWIDRPLSEKEFDLKMEAEDDYYNV